MAALAVAGLDARGDGFGELLAMAGGADAFGFRAIRQKAELTKHRRNARMAQNIETAAADVAILRASGRLSVLRGRRPDSRSSAGSASVHHAANA